MAIWPHKICLNPFQYFFGASLALGVVEWPDVLTGKILTVSPLHVYLIPWHPCIPLPQTHYFVSTHRILISASHSMAMISNGRCSTSFFIFMSKKRAKTCDSLANLLCNMPKVENMVDSKNLASFDQHRTLGISKFRFHPQVSYKSYVVSIFGPFRSKTMFSATYDA